MLIKLQKAKRVVKIKKISGMNVIVHLLFQKLFKA